MTILGAALRYSQSQAGRGTRFLVALATCRVMGDEYGQAPRRLAGAVDKGLIRSARMGGERLVFKEPDGQPEFAAIQACVIETLNGERHELGLGPGSTQDCADCFLP